MTSVAYIGPKSRIESPRKTKIDTEVTHVTSDSDTTFKVKKSKVNLQGAWAYCGGLPHNLFRLERHSREPRIRQSAVELVALSKLRQVPVIAIACRNQLDLCRSLDECV